MEEKRVRCSRLPILEKCPAAQLAPGLELDTTSDASNLGSAFHEVAACLINRENWDAGEVSARWRCSKRDLLNLVAGFRSIWGEVESVFPEPATEFALVTRDADTLLTGTADLFSYDRRSRELRIGDWKSGWLDLPVEPQLRGYGYLGLQVCQEAETVWLASFRLRDRVIDSERLTPELTAWWTGFRAKLRDVRYRAGEHCGRCHRAHECPIKQELMWRTVEDLGAAAAFMERLPTDPQQRARVLIDALGRAKVLAAELERFRELAKADVEALGGELRDGEGMRLQVAEAERREILTAEAWPMLADELGTSRLIEVAEISKTKLEDALKAKAQRGQKGKYVAAVFDQLDVAGALETRPYKVLEVKQDKEIANGDSDNQAERLSADPEFTATHRAAD